MSIGLYIHIPFCLQQCPYCDFATQANNDEDHKSYVDLLLKEISLKAHWSADREVSSIYFGGGTPSLLSPYLILSILKQFEKYGFKKTKDCELTLEINPGTFDQGLLSSWLDLGINRFSVGAQSFSAPLLKKIGRLHSPQDTRTSLGLLQENDLNYSFDLLFALPGQSLGDLKQDLKELENFKPNHISTYYLTIPERHSLNDGRADEDTQLAMFDLVEEQLEIMGFDQYEISNHARPGFHSKHNLHAWKSGQYHGFGMSAHSYLKINNNPIRFWNKNTTKAYASSLSDLKGDELSPELPKSENFERLSSIDQWNDFVHTHLRLATGFSKNAIVQNLDPEKQKLFLQELEQLEKLAYLENSSEIRLLKRGRRNLNYVLEKLFITA